MCSSDLKGNHVREFDDHRSALQVVRPGAPTLVVDDEEVAQRVVNQIEADVRRPLLRVRVVLQQGVDEHTRAEAVEDTRPDEGRGERARRQRDDVARQRHRLDRQGAGRIQVDRAARRVQRVRVEIQRRIALCVAAGNAVYSRLSRPPAARLILVTPGTGWIRTVCARPFLRMRVLRVHTLCHEDQHVSLLPHRTGYCNACGARYRRGTGTPGHAQNALY